MSWREITDEDVLNSLTGPETAAFRSAALRDGQDDPLPEIIITVTDEVRGYIGGCSNNRLEAGATLPRAVIHHAVAIIRYRLISRLPISINDAREQEYKDARSFLKDVAACRVVIEQPSTPAPADEQGKNGGTEIARQGKRLVTRDTMRGL